MSLAISLAAQLRRAVLSSESEPRHGRVSLGFPPADECLKGGLLKGSLHEVFAAEGHSGAAIGFTATLAIRVTGTKPLLWIRQDYAGLEQGEISGSGLVELGFDPSRALVLHVKDATEGLRGFGDALSCAELGAVVFEMSGTAKTLDLTASRRLTLAAAHKGVTPFLLRLDAKPEPSAAETRWSVKSAPSSLASEDWGQPRFEATLLRNRHGALGRWIMEWNNENECFHREQASHPGLVVAPPADRSSRAYPQECRRAG